MTISGASAAARDGRDQGKGRYIANHTEVRREGIEAGFGIGSLPDFAAKPALEAGSIVQVLQDWRLERLPGHHLGAIPAGPAPGSADQDLHRSPDGQAGPHRKCHISSALACSGDFIPMSRAGTTTAMADQGHRHEYSSVTPHGRHVDALGGQMHARGSGLLLPGRPAYRLDHRGDRGLNNSFKISHFQSSFEFYSITLCAFTQARQCDELHVFCVLFRDAEQRCVLPDIATPLPCRISAVMLYRSFATVVKPCLRTSPISRTRSSWPSRRFSAYRDLDADQRNERATRPHRGPAPRHPAARAGPEYTRTAPTSTRNWICWVAAGG